MNLCIFANLSMSAHCVEPVSGELEQEKDELVETQFSRESTEF